MWCVGATTVGPLHVEFLPVLEVCFLAVLLPVTVVLLVLQVSRFPRVVRLGVHRHRQCVMESFSQETRSSIGF